MNSKPSSYGHSVLSITIIAALLIPCVSMQLPAADYTQAEIAEATEWGKSYDKYKPFDFIPKKASISDVQYTGNIIPHDYYDVDVYTNMQEIIDNSPKYRASRILVNGRSWEYRLVAVDSAKYILTRLPVAHIVAIDITRFAAKQKTYSINKYANNNTPVLSSEQADYIELLRGMRRDIEMIKYKPVNILSALSEDQVAKPLFKDVRIEDVVVIMGHKYLRFKTDDGRIVLINNNNCIFELSNEVFDNKIVHNGIKMSVPRFEWRPGTGLCSIQFIKTNETPREFNWHLGTRILERDYMVLAANIQNTTRYWMVGAEDVIVNMDKASFACAQAIQKNEEEMLARIEKVKNEYINNPEERQKAMDAIVKDNGARTMAEKDKYDKEYRNGLLSP